MSEKKPRAVRPVAPGKNLRGRKKVTVSHQARPPPRSINGASGASPIHFEKKRIQMLSVAMARYDAIISKCDALVSEYGVGAPEGGAPFPGAEIGAAEGSPVSEAGNPGADRAPVDAPSEVPARCPDQCPPLCPDQCPPLCPDQVQATPPPPPPPRRRAPTPLARPRDPPGRVASPPARAPRSRNQPQQGGPGCSGAACDGAVVDEVVRRPFGQRVGVTKWFSDRLGYGFITDVSGPDRGADLFTHYTSIHPLNNTRRTLQKGEYVSFDDGGGQAAFVTGVFGGPLMCDHADYVSRTDFHAARGRNQPAGRARGAPPGLAARRDRPPAQLARSRSVLTVSCPEGSTVISSTAAGAPNIEEDIPGSTTQTRLSCDAVMPPFSS